MTRGFVFFSVVVSLIGGGCEKPTSLAGTWEYEEISRTASPDSTFDAVLVSGDSGATTSTVSKVYLTPAGMQVRTEEEFDCVFGGDHIKGLKLVWRTPQLLQIQYDEARILHFKNFWYEYDKERIGVRSVVEIRLAPISPEHSLPLIDRKTEFLASPQERQDHISN